MEGLEMEVGGVGDGGWRVLKLGVRGEGVRSEGVRGGSVSEEGSR